MTAFPLSKRLPCGVFRRAGHMKSVELVPKADASLVKVVDRGLNELFFYLLLDGCQQLVSDRLGGYRRGGIVVVARQIAPQPAHFGERNAVVHIEQQDLAWIRGSSTHSRGWGRSNTCWRATKGPSPASVSPHRPQ